MIKNLIYVYFTFWLSSKGRELVTLAQLVERLTFNQVVGGSSPSCDTNVLKTDGQRTAFLCVVVGSIPAQDA
jgi:hypothetical protein